MRGCGRDSSVGCGERYIYGRSGGAGCGMESVCSRSGGTGFVRREAFKDKPAGVRGVGYFKRFVQEVERVFYSTNIFWNWIEASPKNEQGVFNRLI